MFITQSHTHNNISNMYIVMKDQLPSKATGLQSGCSLKTSSIVFGLKGTG